MNLKSSKIEFGILKKAYVHFSEYNNSSWWNNKWNNATSEIIEEQRNGYIDAHISNEKGAQQEIARLSNRQYGLCVATLFWGA